jgi:outer membrane beta-barrel protein
MALTTMDETYRPGACRSGLRTLMIFGVVLTLGLGLVLEADAQIKPNPEDEIFVLQHKPFLRKGRLELAPSFGATVNDPLIKQFEVGGALTYHISEDFWLAGNFGWLDLGGLGGETDEYNEVLDKTNSAPEVVEQKMYAGGSFGYVPLYGKFAIFDSAIVYYDASIYLGGGFLTHITDTTGGEVGAPAGELGFKMRIFLTRWLSLYVDVKDRMVAAELKDGTSLQQFVIASGGVSIFVPFDFQYTTAR